MSTNIFGGLCGFSASATPQTIVENLSRADSILLLSEYGKELTRLRIQTMARAREEYTRRVAEVKPVTIKDLSKRVVAMMMSRFRIASELVPDSTFDFLLANAQEYFKPLKNNNYGGYIAFECSVSNKLAKISP
ncbi:uncharacterized protein PHALS_10126 [Plasmopara halstedii]|uniref:Uncharacterized protein n=1 Tax=Plasmopara halstedii TaxID=4781 RepID=A0A0P1AFM0_PLAHL|nr:uncharacterized protein PHALS_10126 [Plasmopara halstedii]CEG39898.1 hypothetical protein PHALS_10126 [Plasmopara halstedii]|eukprot:XP_024576267.1 hypothetical protein PHALS_10126 [Plasmopara halstedii]